MKRSEASSYLWAKSDRGRTDGRWLPLIAHLLDVAACTEAILEREGNRLQNLYAMDLGLPVGAVTPWVAALGGLHDLGKAFPGFQLQWKSNGKARGRELLEQGGFSWTASETDGTQPPHAVVSQHLLQSLLSELGFSRGAARTISGALGAHHGFRASEAELAKVGSKSGTGLWIEARQWLLEQVLCVTRAVDYPVPSERELSGEAFMRLAGLVSFADWIGSSARFFPFERSIDDLEVYYNDALKRSRRALEQLGWPKAESRTLAFDEVFGFPPRSLQTKTVDLLHKNHEPALLLIEAPMGEGKTEAALYAHLLLQNGVGHRGFYLALPTQATGNAMFSRTVRFLEKLGFTEPPDLQLVHGAAILDERYADMKLNVGEPWKPEQQVVAREWFTHKKRALLSPHGVGTIDQALLSVLNVRHQFVRLWGLGNRTVILDEVHAYELYTSTLIARLVSWLRALGSSVILLSATLPKGTRQRLLEAYGGSLPEDDKPYPRITCVSGTGTAVEGLSAKPLAYELHEAPLDVEPLAAFLRELSEGGGAIGCIVNTVDRAQKLYKAVKGLVGAAEVKLFHARFPVRQRKGIEDWVVEQLGKKTQESRNVILIATQVAEQSLDIDIDVLVSDLSPVDLLLQRAGRLYRHDDPKTFQRQRPPKHDKARLYIAGLAQNATLPDITTYYWHKVYAPAVLLRTWAAIRERKGLRLPDDLEPLLNLVYEAVPLPGEVSSEFQRALEDAMKKLEEEKREEETLARRRALPEPDGFLDKPFNDVQVSDDDDPELHQALRAATRLGEPSITVILLHLRNGRLYLERHGGEPLDLEREPTFQQAKDFLQHSVSLSNKEVYRHLALPIPEHCPKSWEGSALLRHARVIKLENGSYPVTEKLKLRLDDNLGIVYDRIKPNS